ncbi:DMT family transporter [Rhizobium sp. 32-5/1]|uniref:DMT family transporter n=1 Tax=Rhizobium sp. 32-5/1 TaxID=3019602 RepID=UPI00240E3591|nr:DMT family transporter [Rhizobium sp. 32-5/1]WEZ84559.1 DMT family transporter [Rhizobium sp. 32-5/1]
MNPSVLSGILLTIFSYFLFSLQDAAVKWLVVGLPVFQILFVRSITIFALCLVVGRSAVVRKSIASPVLKPMFIRNLLLLAAWLSYYTAARDLGLAELTTLYYASPILITILAVPILKEHVPPLRWIAVVVGFAGVMVACDPLGAGMTLNTPVLLALQAAVFWAIGTVLLRKTALMEVTLVQMTLSSGFFILFTCVPMAIYWVQPTLLDLGLMAGTGIIAGIAQYALFEGMRRAPVSVLAPFEYSSLVWAFLLGFAIWGDIPGAQVFAGAALIISAGMIIIAGERFSRRLRDS